MLVLDLRLIMQVNHFMRLITYVAFTEETKAIAFEKYLKTASGRAFANKKLR